VPIDSITGPALPVTRTAGSYFSPKSGVDAAWSKVVISIVTPVGSRFNSRSFGCALSDELFGLLDSTTQQLAEYHVRSAVAKFVPEVTVDSVTLARDGRYGLRLSLRFTLKSSGESADRAVSFTPSSVR
jgi:phage baseplate assembly protein W